ncbi:hypothetical protein BIW11_03382, partial [Tropilaelaps mercedesae]
MFSFAWLGCESRFSIDNNKKPVSQPPTASPPPEDTEDVSSSLAVTDLRSKLK